MFLYSAYFLRSEDITRTTLQIGQIKMIDFLENQTEMLNSRTFSRVILWQFKVLPLKDLNEEHGFQETAILTKDYIHDYARLQGLQGTKGMTPTKITKDFND